MIACIVSSVPTPDLEVPTPATVRCGTIRIFEGGSAKWWTTFVSQSFRKLSVAGTNPDSVSVSVWNLDQNFSE